MDPVDPVDACTALGFVDDPALTDDAFDQCVASYPAAAETCTAQDLVDDPARTDDDFDLCVLDQLPAPTATAPPQP